jgi:hypothetical protein
MASVSVSIRQEQVAEIDDGLSVLVVVVIGRDAM